MELCVLEGIKSGYARGFRWFLVQWGTGGYGYGTVGTGYRTEGTAGGCNVPLTPYPRTRCENCEIGGEKCKIGCEKCRIGCVIVEARGCSHGGTTHLLYPPIVPPVPYPRPPCTVPPAPYPLLSHRTPVPPTFKNISFEFR